MRRIIIIALSLVLLSGCSVKKPPRYSVSVDNIFALLAYEGAKVELISLELSAKFNQACRTTL